MNARALNAIAETAPPPRAAPAVVAATETRFASLELFAQFDDVRAEWRALEAFGSPYQGYAFCRAWAETIGAAEGWRPLIALARDGAGAPLALLPLGVRAYGPLRMASFLGGRMANYRMGLFRDDALATDDETRRLLRAIAGAARPKLDFFALTQQPATWRGRANPLVAPGARPARALPTPAISAPAPKPGARRTSRSRPRKSCARRRPSWRRSARSGYSAPRAPTRS